MSVLFKKIKIEINLYFINNVIKLYMNSPIINVEHAAIQIAAI